tara:strand:- start:343 stop:1053 length:711 start_codon:yes stop_codon:yes gene_type:complete
MKYFSKIVFTIILSTIFFSCNNDEEILFDSQEVQQKLGKEISESNWMKISRIDKSEIVVQKMLKSTKLNLNDLNLSNIKKCNYGWTNIDVFEIPFKNNENKRILTYFDGKNSFSIKILINKSLENKNSKVILTDLENLPFYEFEMTKNNTFENFKNYNKNPLYKSGLRSIKKSQNNLMSKAYDPMDNCGNYGFVECLECGMSVCDQDWRCRLASYATGPAFAAGLLITCGLEQLDN